MPDDGRYEEVVTCSRRIFERFGVHPEAVTPQRLSQVVYTVLDAIHASERRLHEPTNTFTRKEMP